MEITLRGVDCLLEQEVDLNRGKFQVGLRWSLFREGPFDYKIVVVGCHRVGRIRVC